MAHGSNSLLISETLEVSDGYIPHCITVRGVAVPGIVGDSLEIRVHSTVYAAATITKELRDFKWLQKGFTAYSWS